MPSFAELINAKVITLSVEVGLDEPIKLKVRQNRVTGRFVQDLQNLGNEGDLRPLCDKLTQVIVEWDLVDEAGETLMISQESIMDLPMTVIRTIIEELVAQLNPQIRKSAR